MLLRVIRIAGQHVRDLQTYPQLQPLVLPVIPRGERRWVGLVRWGVCGLLSVAILYGFLYGMLYFPWHSHGFIRIPFAEGSPEDYAPGCAGAWHDFDTGEPANEEQLGFFGLGFFGLAALACFSVYRNQRGQADRYSPILLAAMVLGFVGGGMGISAMEDMASSQGPPAREITHWALRLSVCSLGTCSLLSAVGLLRLLLKRNQERGRMLALYLFVWGGYFSLLQSHFYLYSPGLTLPNSSVQMPALPANVWAYNFWDWGIAEVRIRPVLEFPFLVELDASGVLTIGEREVDMADEAAVRKELASALLGINEFNVAGYGTGGPPKLWYRIDQSAPFSKVAELMAVHPGAQMLPAFLVTYGDPRGEEWGTGYFHADVILHTLEFPRSVYYQVPEGASPIVLEVLRGTTGGGPEYRIGNFLKRSYVELLQAIEESPERDFQEARVIIKANATTDWGCVAPLMAALENENCLIIGLEVAD